MRMRFRNQDMICDEDSGLSRCVKRLTLFYKCSPILANTIVREHINHEQLFRGMGAVVRAAVINDGDSSAW